MIASGEDTPICKEIRRPLPTFHQWLVENGGTARDERFEALGDLARKLSELKPSFDDQAALVRMWQGLLIAITELVHNEERLGRPFNHTLAMLPRALALAAMYGVTCGCKDETHWRGLAKLMTEEFRAAAKGAADELERTGGEIA
jgi:hypothetical protein